MDLMARIQVHKAGDRSGVFTESAGRLRRRCRKSWKRRRLPAHEVIFDGEVIALRPMARRNLPADDAAVRPQAGRRSAQGGTR